VWVLQAVTVAVVVLEKLSLLSSWMWQWRLGSGFVKTRKGLLVLDVVGSSLDMGSRVMLI
jgi:hypothetical protein